jgi:lipid-binding SYLF domain-containing protein
MHHNTIGGDFPAVLDGVMAMRILGREILTMRWLSGTALVLAMVIVGAGLYSAEAASPQGIESDAQAALNTLYERVPTAKPLAAQAKAILIFPKIVKAGFLVGAQYGEGELLKDGQIAGYYNMAAASYGFQAGVQWFAYAMFFMTDSALNYLDNSAGFEVGAGPSIVVIDAGKAKALSTTTARDDVYAFVFGQKGLMGGVGLQGSKITKISR